MRWLPNIRKKVLKALIEDEGVTDLRHVPDELLNEPQQRVKAHTLAGTVFFDGPNAAAILAVHKLPAYFLDFETIQFAVPIWRGTHRTSHCRFNSACIVSPRAGIRRINLFWISQAVTPRERWRNHSFGACGERGPVFVYSSFEKARIPGSGQRNDFPN